MADRKLKRRSNERWINCEAARIIFNRISQDQREAKKVRVLPSSLLARIQGIDTKEHVASRVVQIDSAIQFAKLCGVNVEEIYANGDGLCPLGHKDEAVKADAAGVSDALKMLNEYKAVTDRSSLIRYTFFEIKQLEDLLGRFVGSTQDVSDPADPWRRTAPGQVASLLPALAKNGVLITDRSDLRGRYQSTLVLEKMKARKLILSAEFLVEFPGLNGMTVWISEPKPSDIAHFNKNPNFKASGWYLYLVVPNFNYDANGLSYTFSGRTALRWLLENSTRENGLKRPRGIEPEDFEYNKPDPLTLLTRIGLIPTVERELISLYWPVQQSDDQIFTLPDGRLCRTYDLIGYPIFIGEPQSGDAIR